MMHVPLIPFGIHTPQLAAGSFYFRNAILRLAAGSFVKTTIHIM